MHQRLDAGADGAANLTPARVAHLLVLLRALAADSQKVRDFLVNPSPYGYVGGTIEPVFGTRVTGRVAAGGERPEAFFRDVVYLKIIYALIRHGRSVDDAINYAQPFSAADHWPDGRGARGQRLSAMRAADVQDILAVQYTIDRASEAAVASLLHDVDALFTAHGRLPKFRPRS